MSDTNNAGRTIKALKRGIVAAVRGAAGPWRYQAACKAIQCSHCGNDAFDEGSAQLNTAGMTFLNLDWANRSATLLICSEICSECAHVEWFAQEPQRQ